MFFFYTICIVFPTKEMFVDVRNVLGVILIRLLLLIIKDSNGGGRQRNAIVTRYCYGNPFLLSVFVVMRCIT